MHRQTKGKILVIRHEQQLLKIIMQLIMMMWSVLALAVVWWVGGAIWKRAILFVYNLQHHRFPPILSTGTTSNAA